MSEQDDKPAVPAKANLQATQGRVGAIVPSDVEQAYRYAQMIASNKMAPSSFNHDPGKIMLAIMHGLEIELPPMAALQSIAIINGQPCIWGDGAQGLILRSGKLIGQEETYEGEGENLTAICKLKRKGVDGEFVGRFSVKDARDAGLLNKDPWKKYLRRMLMHRSRSWARRDGFSDVLKGLHMVEEVSDYVDMEAQSDGSYGAVEVVTDQGVPEPEAQKFELTLLDGNVHEFDDAGDFLSELHAAIGAVDDAKDASELYEANSHQFDQCRALELAGRIEEIDDFMEALCEGPTTETAEVA